MQGFGGEPEGKRHFGIPRHRWEDTIKVDLKEVGWRGMNWIDLAQNRNSSWAFVNVVVNFRVPTNAGNFLTS